MLRWTWSHHGSERGSDKGTVPSSHVISSWALNIVITKRVLLTPLLALAGVILTACASVDFDHPRTPSSAIPESPDSHLARQLRDAVTGRPPGHSGFYPLLDGIDALAARLLLAERAEDSIDVQYYLIKDDIVGNAFIRVLLRAADRGVRVRLLLDDVFTKGYDAGLMALNSHPNIEIRVFNPFRRGAFGRTLGAAWDFTRINRRMHNKSFTVDNQVTVIGGRNIADEYFGARRDAAFGDLDVLGIGPVVGDVSAMFDAYWNHETALPVPAFLPELSDAQGELARVRQDLEASQSRIAESEYAAAVERRVLQYVEKDPSMFQWAPYTLVYDSPDKGIGKRGSEAASITLPLSEALRSAEREIIVISPYFVPRKRGVESLIELQSRGVDVTVVTNSLAANNQLAVHGGYAPARKPLLRNGIRIYEVRPDATVSGAEAVSASGAKATLHTKAFLVDGSRIFVGSFNFDPRSANINTELGVIIEDANLGRRLRDRVTSSLPRQAYALSLDEQGALRWRTCDDGRAVTYDNEPETSWRQRFAAGLMRLLPIRGQL